MTEGDIIVRYTTKDIMKKLEEQHDLMEKVYHQAQMTNGRVTELERRSVGMWVSNHMWQAFIILVLFFAIVISDFRHPIIELLMKLV